MSIDITDYRQTAAQRGWGLGWPSCAGAAGKTVIVTAARSGARFSVHVRIARLVQILVDETERRGYLLDPTQCGAFNCRPISGTKVPSNHSWALAADLNWRRNGYVQPRVTDMPPWMPLLWNRYGWAWGGNYGNNGTTGAADSMHYEFMGTPEQADAMTALALLELGPGGGTRDVPTVISTASEEDPVNIDLLWSADGLTFRGVVGAEAGAGSARYKGGWVKVAVAWARMGPVTTRICALRNGTVVPVSGDVTKQIGDNQVHAQPLPDGTQMVTVEGHRPSTDTLVTATWIPEPR
jgi:D-alanyl-D-alanine carboxypeptidase